ncbi:MAG: AI-2E family transporter [Desulfovibrionaceae bacterium]|nr:AI-2E family transporter [Desulfovibrionaceae bacterium]
MKPLQRRTHGQNTGRPVPHPESRPVRPSRAAMSPVPFDSRRIFYFFLFAMLFLALYLTLKLVLPFGDAIILACIFGTLLHPLYVRIRKRTGFGDYLASGLTLALVVLLFCLPLAFFLSQLIPQASKSIRELALWLSSNNPDSLFNERILPMLAWMNENLLSPLDLDMDLSDLRFSLLSFSRSAGQRMVGWGTGFVVDFITIFIHFLLMLLIMFFMLKDGEGMVAKLKQLSPLREEQKENILQSLRRMANAVLVGGFAIAAIQGLVGGIGLALVGIPPLFWGSLMAAAALVPVLGTGLVWGPAVLYLILNARYQAAIFLFIWGILVTLIDSILRPIILRGNSKISILFLFMSVFGGIKAFGPLGLIYGPLILGFVLAMINIYAREFRSLTKEAPEISLSPPRSPRRPRPCKRRPEA